MEGITATHMKKFVVHLANAAVRVEENEKKKNSIHSRIEDIRKTSLFKGSTTEQIESQINELKNNVTQVFKTERLLLEDQKK